MYCLEKDFVGSEHVAVDEMFGLHEELKRRIDSGHERGVFKPTDNIEVLFVREIAQVSLAIQNRRMDRRSRLGFAKIIRLERTTSMRLR